jgi:cytochrome c oxidase cbb3-type subunit I/II
MRTLGVPYQKGYEKIANDDLTAQAKQIADELNAEEDINTSADKEIIALIAYLQRLGTDILVDK